MLRRDALSHVARRSVLAILATLGVALCRPASAQDIGRSQEDQPVIRGQFSITNTTDAPITYLVRWGNRGFWDKVVLQPGWTETHREVLDENLRAPTPHVQFRRWHDGRVGTTTYRMEFYAVTNISLGGVSGTSKPYYFGPSDAQILDLFAY
jgi:hypothetical protein